MKRDKKSLNAFKSLMKPYSKTKAPGPSPNLLKQIGAFAFSRPKGPQAEG